jgi:chemotaxis signal transduction protein
MAEEQFEPVVPDEEKPRTAVDWSALFEAMSDRAAEDKAAEILKARARRLALPEEEPVADAGSVYVLFTLGPERYALSTAAVAEVAEAPDVTPVPRAPAAIAGLFHRRGGVYLALATKNLVGLGDGGTYRDALVLAGGVPRVALLVDEVTATRVVPATEIHAGDVGGRAVAGVTTDHHIVLDADALWAEARRALGIDEEGG